MEITLWQETSNTTAKYPHRVLMLACNQYVVIICNMHGAWPEYIDELINQYVLTKQSCPPYHISEKNWYWPLCLSPEIVSVPHCWHGSQLSATVCRPMPSKWRMSLWLWLLSPVRACLYVCLSVSTRWLSSTKPWQQHLLARTAGRDFPIEKH